MTDVNLRGRRLSINIVRDCWELGFSDKNLANEFHIVDSRLSISSVVSLEWMFDGLPAVDNSAELWISSIRYSSDTTENMTHSVISSVTFQHPDLDDRGFVHPGRLTLNGYGWSLQIILMEDRIKLADKDVPYLHTDRMKKKN
jgi:hypothetical protein